MFAAVSATSLLNCQEVTRNIRKKKKKKTGLRSRTAVKSRLGKFSLYSKLRLDI